MTEFRPHEAEDALDYYRNGFQRPRRTLREAAAEAERAGFEVLSASRLRLPLLDPHRAFYSRALLRECRRVFPSLEPSDLLAVTGTLVLRRR